MLAALPRLDRCPRSDVAPDTLACFCHRGSGALSPGRNIKGTLHSTLVLPPTPQPPACASTAQQDWPNAVCAPLRKFARHKTSAQHCLSTCNDGQQLAPKGGAEQEGVGHLPGRRHRAAPNCGRRNTWRGPWRQKRRRQRCGATGGGASGAIYAHCNCWTAAASHGAARSSKPSAALLPAAGSSSTAQGITTACRSTPRIPAASSSAHHRTCARRFAATGSSCALASDAHQSLPIPLQIHVRPVPGGSGHPRWRP